MSTFLITACKSNNRVYTEYERVHCRRKSKQQNRPLSLDELMVLNALLHRRWHERRMEADVVGGLIQKGTTVGRAVLERLHERGLIEPRGDGRSRHFMLSATLYRRLEMKAEYVRARGFEPLQHEQMVLAYAQEHGRITRSEAADLCHLSGPQASRLLARLAEKHSKLSPVGERRGAHYVWEGGAGG